MGCGAHHQICEVHHLKHWKHGGETTLENTCLLCWRCHHVRVHQNGEEITRHPGGKLTLAPPANPPPGTAGPTGGGRTDGHEPRSRGPGHRHAHHRHRTRPSATTAPNPTRHPVPATP
ncbi:MAG: HNH endonuclease [bacterium]|nr:HNH endonuclease [bacterium]